MGVRVYGPPGRQIDWTATPLPAPPHATLRRDAAHTTATNSHKHKRKARRKARRKRGLTTFFVRHSSRSYHTRALVLIG